jgi:hypothetical protein
MLDPSQSSSFSVKRGQLVFAPKAALKSLAEVVPLKCVAVWGDYIKHGSERVNVIKGPATAAKTAKAASASSSDAAPSAKKQKK